MNSQKSRSGYAQKGWLRRRPNAAATSFAEAWLHLADARLPAPKSPLALWPARSCQVDLLALKAAKAIANDAKTVKIIGGGEIKSAVTLNGVGATAMARKAVEAAGGKVVEAPEAPRGKLK